jgi:hypothetical protein
MIIEKTVIAKKRKRRAPLHNHYYSLLLLGLYALLLTERNKTDNFAKKNLNLGHLF